MMHKKIVDHLNEFKLEPLDGTCYGEFKLVPLDGACYGFAQMAVQAILCNQIDRFSHRLTYLEKMTSQQLAVEINGLKKARKKRQLTDEELTLEEVPAFLQGMTLYQRGPEFFSLFGKNRPKSQYDVQPILSLEFSEGLAKQGGLFEGLTLTGVYTKTELEIYFEALFNTAFKQLSVPVAMLLSTAKHSVVIGYDPAHQKWLLVDINDLPVKPIAIADIATLSQRILTAFGRKTNLIFTTKIYSVASYQQVLRERMTQLQQNKEWQSIHAITPSKAKLKDIEDFTWLIIATKAGQIDTVTSLILAGADVNAVAGGDLCLSSIFAAVIFGHLEIVKELVKAGANVNFEVQEGKDIITPLHLAIFNGYLEIVKVLLDVANPGLTDEGRTKLLFDAIHGGHLGIVDALLDAGAKVNLAARGMGIKGVTPLVKAVQVGCPEMVKKLLERGANPNPPLPLPLIADVIAHSTNVEVVKVLLEAAAVNGGLGFSDASLVYLAAQCGKKEIVEFFIDKGVNPMVPVRMTVDGLQKSVVISMSKDMEIKKRVLALIGAKVTMLPYICITPGEIATAMGHLDVAALCERHAPTIMNGSSLKPK